MYFQAVENQSPEHSCLNCGATYTGHFCPECGQSARVGRVSFKETIADFFSASFALEGPLMGTILLLLKNPGKVLREFLSGRRKTYYRPVAFFILLTAIYILIRALLDYNPVSANMSNVDNPEQVDMNKVKEAALFMFKHMNSFLFLLVLGMALTFKLFFWKRYRLAEYTVIGFYLSGIYILFGTLVMLWNHFTPFDLPNIHLLFLVIYIALSSISLFQSRSFGTIFKSGLVGVFSFVTYLFLAFGTSYLIVSLMN